MTCVMPPRRRSKDLAFAIEEECKKIYTSASFNLFKGKVCDYDSSTADSTFLSPDQEAVDKFFQRTRGGPPRPDVRNVLETFFYSTVKACDLYRMLLKGIQVAKQNQTSINQALHLVHIVQQDGNNIPSPSLHHSVLEELKTFAASENPFPQETLDQFNLVKQGYGHLEQDLGEMKKTLDAELRKVTKRTRILQFVIVAAGSPVLLCLALPAALAGLVVSTLSNSNVMATVKSWWFAVKEQFNNDVLKVECAQLDAAGKGNYIIIQDLMTIERQVTRLRNDVENTKHRILYFEEKMKDYGCLCVVVQQIRINTASAEQQMQDFSEQVVLCCRTLEKARQLVFEKITGHQWDRTMDIDPEDTLSSGDDE